MTLLPREMGKEKIMTGAVLAHYGNSPICVQKVDICKIQATLICRKKVTLIIDFDSKMHQKMFPFHLNEFLNKKLTLATVCIVAIS